jgi:quinol monooxygenase YgiN
MSFVQILEFDTKQSKEVESLLDEWRDETADRRTARRQVMARNHAAPDRYVAIVEFGSWEDAQHNSKLAETERFAAKMSELCDGPVKYGDYDVIRDKD